MVKVSSFATFMAAALADEPLKVLFVGNSFTYGPPPYDRYDQLQLNNLPRLFKLVAESKGKKVIVGEDTIGGCTIYMHAPSRNPEACTDEKICRLVNTTRMPAENGCTVSADFMKGEDLSSDYHSCPQLLMRQPHGPWDMVVLQDNSALSPVQEARYRMMYPGIKEFSTVLKTRLRSKLPRKEKPLIASYMTWSYLHGGTKWDIDTGNRTTCPGGTKEGCYPLGDLDEMTDCNNSDFHLKIDDQACQAYAVARGYAESLRHGADVVVPAGLAWQLARGSEEIPAACKAMIDAEYPDAGPLASLALPLHPKDPSDARWQSAFEARQLFRDLGPNYTSGYCPLAENCTNDHHPSIIGMYLNSLVFFATLFKEDPVGAAWPDNQTVVDGMLLPAVDPKVAQVMQRLARDTVMNHLDVWWGKTEEQDLCPWLSSSSKLGVLDCADFTSCNAELSGWDCCGSHGGRSRCPPNTPLMCADTACSDGTDHCCRQDCSDHGGPRPCHNSEFIF